MRIAQVAPLYESVPPAQYGGTERVVSYITEELVADGHDVTLFASGDSVTNAKLIAPCPRALRLAEGVTDHLCLHFLMLDQVFERAAEFDVIHFHVDYMHFPISHWRRVPHVTTLHGRLDIPELEMLYRRFCYEPLVSISDAQRKPLAWANWQATIHHGLPIDLYAPQLESGKYLAFVGRISPEKRLDRAVEIARRSGMELKIAAKVDAADREYFKEIRHLLKEPGVEFIGEIGDCDKARFLGEATALLFPIDWPEPFGLVMIEALACGTPVIAWPCGSVPEVISHGQTGYICESIDEAVQAVERIGELSRSGCRAAFEERFLASQMARRYVSVYRRLLGEPEDGTDAHGRYSVSGPVLHTGDVVADC